MSTSVAEIPRQNFGCTCGAFIGVLLVYFTSRITETDLKLYIPVAGVRFPVVVKDTRYSKVEQGFHLFEFRDVFKSKTRCLLNITDDLEASLGDRPLGYYDVGP